MSAASRSGPPPPARARPSDRRAAASDRGPRRAAVAQRGELVRRQPARLAAHERGELARAALGLGGTGLGLVGGLPGGARPGAGELGARGRPEALRRARARQRVGGPLLGVALGPAGVARVAAGGLRLVQRRADAGVGVGDDLLDALRDHAADRALGDLDAVAGAPRAALALARPPRAPARLARGLLGALRPPLGGGQATFQGRNARVGGVRELGFRAPRRQRLPLRDRRPRDARAATARPRTVRLEAGRAHGVAEAPAERALGGVGRRPDPVAVALGAPVLRAPARQRRVPVGRARRLAVAGLPLEDLRDDGLAGPAPYPAPARGLRGRGHDRTRPLGALGVRRGHGPHACAPRVRPRLSGRLEEVREAGAQVHPDGRRYRTPAARSSGCGPHGFEPVGASATLLLRPNRGRKRHD